MLHGIYEHKNVIIRKRQFKISDSQRGLNLARNIIVGKLKNQKATLLYASRKLDVVKNPHYIDSISAVCKRLKNIKNPRMEFIFSCEGAYAKIYFDFIKDNNLFPKTFTERFGRNSDEITNCALNYGYAILQNIIYKSIVNAGLEPYCGVLHTDRSSKPSLVLDIIEEYRSFLVDRNIIKMKKILENAKDFDSIKRLVVKNILKTLEQKVKYKKNKLSLESIIQRQIYQISGYFSDVDRKYKPYVFRW